MDDIEYMKIAYKEALKAYDIDEVPIGAIVVKDGNIIGASFNQKESLRDVSAHAEMLAIREACKALCSWHLDDCILYSTLEPCMMCSTAIIQSRIAKVVYGAHASRWPGLSECLSLHQFNHKPIIVEGVLKEECSLLLSQYFKQKRS